MAKKVADPAVEPMRMDAWYAVKPFTTMYQGQMLTFKVDQIIDVPGMGEFLHRGGSPVEQREG